MIHHTTSADRQLRLFPTPVHSMASLRTLCGDFFEDLTRRVSGAHRLKTDSRNWICPDLMLSVDEFLETKSMGRTNCVLIYKHRLEKEQRFCNTGMHLHYWIWSHAAKLAGSPTQEDVRCRLSWHLRAVYILRFSTLVEIVKNEKVKTINNLYYSNKHRGGEKRGIGYSIHRDVLRQNCAKIGETKSTTISGTPVKSVPIYGVPGNFRWV